MANNLKYSVTIRNNQLDEITAQIGSNGKLRLYGDTQPTNVGTALSGQTLVADLALSATAAGAASSGALTFSAISDDTSADASDTVTWGTITQSDNTREIDFTVGTSGTDMIIDNDTITAGQVVSCSSFVITGGNA